MTLEDIPNYNVRKDENNEYGVGDIVKTGNDIYIPIAYYIVQTLGNGAANGKFKALWRIISKEEVLNLLYQKSNFIDIF